MSWPMIHNRSSARSTGSRSGSSWTSRAAGPSWEACKKIDIRYHELSPQGYFQRLRTTGIVSDLVTPAEIDHARRNPPSGTPAAVRGRYIREFGLGDDHVTANWRAVFLTPKDSPRRTIRLDRVAPSSADNSGPPRRHKTQRKDSGGT